MHFIVPKRYSAINVEVINHPKTRILNILANDIDCLQLLMLKIYSNLSREVSRCRFHLFGYWRHLIMPITKFLFFFNLIVISIFAFAIKTGFLEKFLSKIGNIRVKRLARNLEKEKNNSKYYHNT